MFHHFHKTLSLITLLSSTLLLSGCIADKQFSLLPEFQGHREVSEPQEVSDPDLQLVSAEAEDTLNQELEALSETGQWGDGKTAVKPSSDQQNTSVFDFPLIMNKQVEVYLNLFTNKQRNHFARWLTRSGKYVDMMEQELAKAGLPRDLAYLSMIESGYNQRAYSKARAVGLWQFMRATGKQYNLKIDSYIDERCDAEKSTAAAVAFLKDLYRDFGDWHLAVAAYNAGPGKIRKGMKRYKVDNFWDLARHRYLKLETKRYVPKLIATIMIAREPEKYGFTSIDYAAPLAFDTLEVGPGMSLEAVAVVAGSDTRQIKELNPELRKGKTPVNLTSYQVKIPAGTKSIAGSNMERLHSFVSTGYKTHKIRKGETLAAICRKYDINTTTLLKVNNLRSRQLRTGTRLRIPYSTIKYRLLPEGGSANLAAYQENLILHRIKPGETVSKIARKYNVPKELIVSWNGLKSIHSIRAGQQLALFIEGAGTNSLSGKHIAASAGKKLVADNIIDIPDQHKSAMPVLTAQKKLPPTIEPQDIEYSWYKVRNGDSLWTISRRFNTSTEKIRKWNNLNSNLIKPGSRLKVRKG